MNNSNKKQTQQRVLVIKNFKNIGVSKLDSNTYELSDKPEELLISANYADDKAGGLVVIIGENNTGKSNVNRALAKFIFQNQTTEAFDANDIPNYIDYNDCEPTLDFIERHYTNMGGGGDKYVSHTIASIVQEDSEISYSFCSENEALRVAIKIHANTLKRDVNYSRTMIDNIVLEASDEKDTKKLINCYIKLKNMELKEEHKEENNKLKARYNMQLAAHNKKVAELEAEYQDELNTAYNELKDSAKTIIAKINDYDQQYDIFYYARAQKSKQEYKAMFEELQDSILNTQYYNEVVEGYGKLKTFVHDVVGQYNARHGGYYGRKDLSAPAFLTPKKVVKKTKAAPVLQEAVFTPAAYQNASEILDEVFADTTFECSNNTYMLLPKIIDYDNNRKFINSDLITSLDGLESSHFFQSFFGAINKKMGGVLSVYEKAKTTTPGYLIREQEEINKRIERVITKRFNEIYGKNGDDAYRFDIKLDKEEISVSIFKGDDVVVLDNQSVGFKWFFNIYFNLLNGKILKSGDIVLMDEPAHNLSPKARKECAEFLRKYGEENGITFLIVTHDLFWIDSDCLNEVRIIKNREDKELKGVSIQNDFSRIESSDTDTFLEIKRAFGVDTHVFYPPSVRTIFVEGITDYNYLTTFKLLKEKESGERLNIVFLPIGGLGKEGEKEIVLEKLMAQCKEPILLVDADRAADELLKIKEEKNYEKLEIIKLSDIDSKFEEIENLFSKNDMEKYGLETKSGSISSSFKKHILWNKEVEDEDKLEQSTKANFYKLLEHLAKNV